LAYIAITSAINSITNSLFFWAVLSLALIPTGQVIYRLTVRVAIWLTLSFQIWIIKV
jgi:hypothetical protein